MFTCSRKYTWTCTHGLEKNERKLLTWKQKTKKEEDFNHVNGGLGSGEENRINQMQKPKSICLRFPSFFKRFSWRAFFVLHESSKS